MDDLNALERQIGDELRREIGPVPRFDVATIVRSVVTSTPRRGWSVVPRIQSRIASAPTKGRFTMFSGLKSIAAGVVVALLGGFLLAGAFTTQQGHQSAPAAGTLDTSEPWDLVWFSDSGGWGVADLWAAQIEEDLGVEVRVHDHAVGSLSAVEVLDSLSEPSGGFTRLGDTRDEVTKAEIIVVYGNPQDSGASDALETCVSTSPIPRDPPTIYSGEGLEPYREILESIYERVFALVGDRPVIVRAIDLYNPVLADWRLAGIEAECTDGWEAWSDTMRAAAAEFGVPLVSMYDAFNGPDHTADPRLEGYIASDGEHLLPPGREVAAAALHEAGYEPIAP